MSELNRESKIVSIGSLIVCIACIVALLAKLFFQIALVNELIIVGVGTFVIGMRIEIIGLLKDNTNWQFHNRQNRKQFNKHQQQFEDEITKAVNDVGDFIVDIDIPKDTQLNLLSKLDKQLSGYVEHAKMMNYPYYQIPSDINELKRAFIRTNILKEK